MAIEAAMTAATTAITDAKNAVLIEAETVKSAFDGVAAELDAVLADLPSVVAGIQAGIAEVVETLQKIHLDPYFDTAIEVMETTASVVEAVPLDLLPDDVEADLQDAVRPIKAIDFDQDVRQVLIGQLNQALSSLDTDVLAEVDRLYLEIVQFLQDNHPRPEIEQLEITVFDEMLSRLQAIDPDAILQAVAEVLDEMKQAVATLDLRTSVLDEVDSAFDDILTHYDQLDPAALLQPVAERIDAVRTSIKELMGIESWADQLDRILEQLLELVERFDLAEWVPRLEAQLDVLLTSLRDDARGAPLLGKVVAALAGDGVRVTAFEEMAQWLRGENGAERVRALLAQAVAHLQQSQRLVTSLDLEDTVARAAAWHRGLVAALETHRGTLLHQQLAPALQVYNPQSLFAPALAYGPRYARELTAQLGEIETLATSGFSEILSVAEALREGLRPLVMVQQRFADMLRQFGLDPDGKSPLEIIADILGLLRPSTILEPLQSLLATVALKIFELVEQGLIEPIKAGIAELQTAIDRIDITFIVTELSSVHAVLRSEINALRPSLLLAEPLSAFEALQTRIADYDPLQSVRAVIDAFKAAVAELTDPDSPLRPTILLDALLTTYESILSMAGDLNIREVLQPILDELQAISGQLDEGLERSGEAFGRLKEALP